MMPSRYCVCQGKELFIKNASARRVSHRPAKRTGHFLEPWMCSCDLQRGRKEEHSRKPDGHSMSLWDEVLLV